MNFNSSVFVYVCCNKYLFLNIRDWLSVIVKLLVYAAEAILLGFQHYLVMLGSSDSHLSRSSDGRRKCKAFTRVVAIGHSLGYADLIISLFPV